jgi:hypothetical protein
MMLAFRKPSLPMGKEPAPDAAPGKMGNGNALCTFLPLMRMFTRSLLLGTLMSGGQSTVPNQNIKKFLLLPARRARAVFQLLVT